MSSSACESARRGRRLSEAGRAPQVATTSKAWLCSAGGHYGEGVAYSAGGHYAEGVAYSAGGHYAEGVR